MGWLFGVAGAAVGGVDERPQVTGRKDDRGQADCVAEPVPDHAEQISCPHGSVGVPNHANDHLPEPVERAVGGAYQQLG